MTSDKREGHFITKQRHQSESMQLNTKKAAVTLINHNNINQGDKFNRTNTPLLMVDICARTFKTQQMAQRQDTTCIIEQKHQKQHQQPTTQHTIIGKVLKHSETAMAQQALKQTHMTLEEYFGNSNCTTNANAVIATATKTTLASSRKINKNIYRQQNNTNKVEELRSTFANNTDPLKILRNLEAIPSPLSLSTLLLTPALPPSSSPTLRTTAKRATQTETFRATNINIAAMTKVLTIPVFRDVVVGTLESKIQGCLNICINSECGSKQSFAQQQNQERYCKSTNITSCKNNSNKIRTSSKTNINSRHTATSADAATQTALASVGDIINSNKITTTNKANIRLNTNSITTNTTAATHTDNNVNTAVVATGPTESTTPATTTFTYCKAFPLRQRFCQSTKQLVCLLRAVVFSFMFVMSMQYQTVSASTSMINKHEPMFISRSETFKFVAGETIILPCEVANTDPYVVAWKRGIAILTAGSVKVTPDPRVRLINGFNLQIRDAVPQDAGDYICQIATMEPREITHTVEILVPPRIHHISTSGHLQVKKGSSVRIECSASGNPTPNVTWSRKNNILPNGEEKLHSHILSIENVDRHKGGIYICTANNGVGQPASSQVVLHVLYPPEITVERPVVFSGEGHEAMLVCIVHGETQPEVIWFKDTMQLDTTERHIMENRGSRHTLIIRKVHPQDFGNYSCVAENQLGKSRKTLQLSGKPNLAVFNSPPISQYKDRYNISWTVESHTPIEEYKLSFRRLQQGQEVDNAIDSRSSSSSSLLQMYSGSSNGNLGPASMMGVNAHNYRLGGISSMNNMGGSGGYGSYGAANVMHWGRNDWRDVVLPAIPISHHYTQGMSYMIRGLDPDQHYEATVQARNRYGWSDYSQSFVFSTSSNDNEMRDLSVTFYGSKSSHLQALSFLLLIIFGASLCLFN